MRKKVLSKTVIVFIMMSSIFAFRNVINNQVQFGLLTIILFLLAGIIYAIPFALLSNEFASIKDLKGSEAGVGSWVTYAMGKKIGFLASWSTFFSNLFFFATIAPLLIISLGFLITGQNAFDLLAKELFEWLDISEDNATRISSIILSLCSIIIFWISSYISKFGAKSLNILSKVGGLASLILAAILIFGCLFITLPFITSGQLSKTFTWEFLNPLNEWGFNGDIWSMISAASWIMISFAGIETMAVFINDTRGGSKEFKKASIFGTLMIISISVVCSLIIGISINQIEITETWGLSNSYFRIFPALFHLPESSIGYKILIRFVGLIFFLNILGSLLFWTVAPVKVLFSESPKGIFGKLVEKQNSKNIPTNGLIVQGILVSIILLLVGITTTGKIGEGSSTFLTTITQTTVVLNLLPPIFLTVSWLWIKNKKNDVEREYVFCKSKWSSWIIGITILTILTIAFIFGIIPSPIMWSSETNKAWINLALGLGGFILFEAFAIILLVVWNKKQKKINQS